MPTYEYACTACGHRLDAVQSFFDDPLTECPECGGALRKVYGAVRIAFKGSGFYKTDSRESAAKPAHEAKKSDEVAPVSSDAKGDKVDAKPATNGTGASKETKEARPAAAAS